MKRLLAVACLLVVALAGCVGPAATEETPAVTGGTLSAQERTPTAADFNTSRAKQMALARAERAALDSVDESEHDSGIGGSGGSGAVTATITETNETGVFVRTSVPYYVSGPELAADLVHREIVFVSFDDLAATARGSSAD